MRLDRPLDDFLRTRAHVRVLRAVFELPEGFAASARDIARRAGVSHPTASSVLTSLARQGLLTVRRTPRADLYSLDVQHEAVGALRGLIEWERGLRDDFIAFLKRGIEERIPSVTEAWLFGSAARGEMTESSDVDLAVICPKSERPKVEHALDDLAGQVMSRYGLRLSSLLGTKRLSTFERSPTKPETRVKQEGLRILGPTEGAA